MVKMMYLMYHEWSKACCEKSAEAVVSKARAIYREGLNRAVQ